MPSLKLEEALQVPSVIHSEKNYLLSRLDIVGKRIGGTPCIPLQHDKIHLHAKVEFLNLVGSIKDRTAYSIIRGAVERGEITTGTTVIEASSGNFAVSTAAICHLLGIAFTAVIDPGINRVYRQMIENFATETIVVEEKDSNGGYLLTKLEAVRAYCEKDADTYWTNQYENIDNLHAHYHGTAGEICQSFEQLDYAFIAVATGGTIAGISRRLKEHFPTIRIVAVDAEGSVIFSNKPRPRYIPGMGSGIRPPLIEKALIDDVVIVSETDTLAACRKLFFEHALFVGGSSGTVFHAVESYFADRDLPQKPQVVFICPDRGIGYADSIYRPEWRLEFERLRAAERIDGEASA